MENKMKRIIYILLALLAITATMYSCEKLPTGPDDIPDTDYQPKTPLGKMLVNSAAIGHIYADSTFLIAQGVEETDVHVQLMSAKVEHIFFIKADLTQPGLRLKVGMPYDADVYAGFTRQTPSDMIEYVDAPGRRVAAVVNGDFWDVSNGNIRGPIHRNGKILKDSFIYSTRLNDQALSFFGLDYDGKPIIRDTNYYKAHKYDIKDCTGTGVMVLQEGIVPADFSTYSTYRHPRTCVGYTPDLKTVYFFICDGRTSLWSDGMMYDEMGEIMKSLGCSWATNLDGGGSSQLVIRHPVANVFQLRNRASDGAERAIVNSWMVLVNEP
jgi:hypothetical protein